MPRFGPPRAEEELMEVAIALITEGRFAQRLHALEKKVEQIMSQITDYVDKVEAAFSEINDDLASMQKTAADMQTQIAALQKQLSDGGNLSDADKTALDRLATDAGTLANTADVAAGKAAAPTAPGAPVNPA